jgi:hypothetical protein
MQNNNMQHVNFFMPIKSTTDSKLPLHFSVSCDVNWYMGAGTMSSTKNETYVLLNVLPDELKQRVITAIQAASFHKQ